MHDEKEQADILGLLAHGKGRFIGRIRGPRLVYAVPLHGILLRVVYNTRSRRLEGIQELSDEKTFVCSCGHPHCGDRCRRYKTDLVVVIRCPCSRCYCPGCLPTRMLERPSS